jgi:hypothetical protein
MALFALLGVLSPRRRLYPPACRPYGLEAEPEAAGFRPRRNKVSLGRKTMLVPPYPFSKGDGGCGLTSSPRLRRTPAHRKNISYMTGSLPANPVH